MSIQDSLVACALIIVGGLLVITGNGEWILGLVFLGILLL